MPICADRRETSIRSSAASALTMARTQLAACWRRRERPKSCTAIRIFPERFRSRSLELGKVISEQQDNIIYRFVSDHPFKNRPPHALDPFEINALTALRQNSNQQLAQAVQRSSAPDRAGD